MRDDLPLRPAFDPAAVDDDQHLNLRPAGFDPVQPGEPSRAWRIFSIGASGACALGLALGLMTLKGQAATGSAKAGASTAESAFRPIKADYAAPNREQVARALEESKRLLADEGLSGLARASIVCFDKLTREPAYPLMDYCLALDIYGAQAYARTAGEAAPPSTYFGQGAMRRQTAVQSLIAGQTDANSRLIDTNRLAEDVALKTQLAELGVAPPTPEAAPPATLTVARIEAPPPPPPAPPETAKRQAAPAKAQPALVRVAKPAVRKPPVQARAVKKDKRPAMRAMKPAAPPVRALAKAKPAPKPKPKPKLLAKPTPVEAEPNWPDVLLTRLQSEDAGADFDRPPRRY